MLYCFILAGSRLPYFRFIISGSACFAMSRPGLSTPDFAFVKPASRAAGPSGSSLSAAPALRRPGRPDPSDPAPPRSSAHSLHVPDLFTP